MKARPRSLKDIAIRVLEAEATAIRALAPRLDSRFLEAVDILGNCQGKIAVVGMGKSGIICKKIAATFSSTGSPSIFLHAAEAAHGDLGLLGPQDVVLALSKSGETPEILRILSVLKRLQLPLVALVGHTGSTLDKHADVSLDVSVDEEACPLGLAPTTSTTAALAMGDALAIVLMQRKGFQTTDFASVHPAGAIGKKLLRVDSLMHSGDSVPRVGRETPMKDVVAEMSRGGLGMAAVVSPSAALVGVITDGDLRRLLQDSNEPLRQLAEDCMNRDPKTITPDELAATALAKMERLKITSLVVVDGETQVLGVIQIHDLWKIQLF